MSEPSVESGGAPRSTSEPTFTVTTPPAPVAPPQQIDIEALRKQWEQEEAARRQELEQRLRSEYDERFRPIEEERQRIERERQEAEQARLEAERKAREEQETAAERYERQLQETQAEIARVREENEQHRAMLAKEREFNELQEYRRQQLAANSEQIHPSYSRFVKGYNREEIDASIQEAIAASQELLSDIETASQQFAQQQQVTRQQMPGVTPTAPATGPMEMVGATRTLTPDQIKNMPMHEYAHYREQLGVTGNGRGQDLGIFG